MAQAREDELRNIKTFPQLVRFLRDELDWPIESGDFDELTFDYEPEELGLDPKSAVKIKEIKQLRPLVTNQPWGVFFLNFEPKRLPIVILRRILQNLTIKKRKAAARSERPAWHMHDLLFISSYGDSNERGISFAHFSEPPEERSGDLPTLRVLGWDDQDTVLHLGHTERTLKDKLRWYNPHENLNAWQERWSSAFVLRPREVITTSKELAIRLAELARRIRRRANLVLSVETERGPLRKLHKAFREALIHDLSEDDFADMYAQTITYGLFSAACSRPAGVIAENLADMVPVTNPFLKEMLSTFLTVGGRKSKIDFDELGIQDVVDLLNSPDTHMDAILRDFGKKTQQDDPVVHFYELFLKEYDKKKKVQRGVFYTPRPVVSFIVRSVHELLQTEFGLEDGLASTITWGEFVANCKAGNRVVEIPKGVEPSEPFVQILDPAVGTATFLVEVINVIHKTMLDKWQREGKLELDIPRLWNEYVPKHLLPRIYGYELMMAPYAIAHMRLGLKLAETGYRLASSTPRANVYLTNSLEPPSKLAAESAASLFEALGHEAQTVNAVKRQKRFTVVIGNPPYAGHSSNKGDWITRLVDDYYTVDGMPLGERNPKWLQDDYVKFIRLGQHILSQSGCGLQSYITNHGYLDNPTFRGMRQQFMAAFSAIDVLDLHGNTTKKEVCPDGSEDVNVFDIKQGVAIFAARSHPVRQEGSCTIQHAALFGTQNKKYSQLVATTFSSVGLTDVEPSSPFYLFVPQDSDLEGEYAAFQKMTDAMPVNVLGFQTHRDEIAVAFGADDLFRQVKNYLGHPPQKRDWDRFQSLCTYRLFDVRVVYLHTAVCDRPRRELLDHVVRRDNICLGLGRQGIAVQDPVWSLIAVSRHPMDANIFRRGGINIFPLYLYPEADALTFHSDRRLNLSEAFIKGVTLGLSLPQKTSGEIPRGLVPEQILHYTYAVFHSPTYRTRYAEFLKIDFPRLPLTSSLDLFRDLAELGGELVALHLMESPKLSAHITSVLGAGEFLVEKVSYSDETVWLDKQKTQGFRGVPEEVWNFHIGGYQVCEKWLKDRQAKGGKNPRPGRILTNDDINHYQRIVVALHETIRIMGEIDKVIEKHGGWPIG